MSNTRTISFITKTINYSTIVPSSKLDRVLKAIINNFKVKKTSKSLEIIDYLNTLRIIYYIKRLKFKNNLYYLQTISIYTLDSIYKCFTKFFLDSSLEQELNRVNLYLLIYSIIFKDNSKSISL